MDHVQWMGHQNESKTADKNITIIHNTTPINIFISEKLHVYKRQIHHKGILTLNILFCQKYKFIIHKITSSSEKIKPYCTLTLKFTDIFV